MPWHVPTGAANLTNTISGGSRIENKNVKLINILTLRNSVYPL